MGVVVRFAPSPTGHLHLGGVRTALFNWLFGRQRGGAVRLRLEDTDRARSRESFARSIVDALEWLGLTWDGPVVRQSERTELYARHLARLEREGKVYRCTCPPAELDKAREKARAAGRSWRYPGTCRERSVPPRSDEPFVLRLRVPEAGPRPVHDLLGGSLSTDLVGLDDFVLTRSDGSPLYNLCCVVDDAEMGVSHVVRGADHVDNTLKQAALYDAFGLERPAFAHLPLVRAMSKRRGSTSVQAFREQGYLPEALLNYVARLGWSHGDQEVFTLAELVERFTLDGVGRSPGAVNEDKLGWLNEQHLRRTPPERLAELVRPRIEPELLRGAGSAARLVRVAELLAARSRTLADLARAARPLLAADDRVRPGERGLAQLRGAGDHLVALADRLEGLESFEAEALERTLETYRRESGLDLPKLARPCRTALTGDPTGPRLVDVMVALGRRSVVERLRHGAGLAATLVDEDGGAQWGG